jgi:hypothetical protein
MKLRVVLIATMMLLVLGTGSVGAQQVGVLALPALSSGFQLQNLSTADAANIVIQYYDENGDLAETDTDTIGAQSSKSYYVPDVLGQPDGRYSVVVSSSQALNALVNTVTASGTPYVAATHSGVTGEETGSPLYIPWVVVNYYGFNSMFAVQNAGSSAATVYVEFYQSGQSSYEHQYSQSVKPGGSWYVNLTETPYSTDLPDATSLGFYGAVKIYSTGDSTPLAAVLMDTNPSTNFLRSYNAVKTAADKLYAPQVTANYYGFSSGITLQNPNTFDVSATIDYYASGSSTPLTSQNVTVGANSASPIYLPNISGMVTDFNGTAVIEVTTSGGTLMGIANHDHVPAGPAASYNLIPEGDAATTLYLPQVVRDYYGFEAGFQIYNIGPEDVTVEVRYYATGATTPTHTETRDIPADSAWTQYLGDSRGDGLGSNFNGGATIEVTSGNGALVGLGNFVAPYSGDYQQVYNAFH